MDEPEGHREGMLWAFLEHANEQCPSCGYSLRGLRGVACPECGEELRLRVGPDAPAAGWYSAGLIGISMALGSHLLPLLLILPMEPGTAVPLLPGTTIAAASLAGWIRARRRLSRASTLTRSTFMSAALVLPVVLLILSAVLVVVFES